MTIRVGKFEKISIAQFNKDVKDSKITYNEIPLPVRATKGSAGYDIKTLFDIDLQPDEDIKVPTGLKCKIDNGWGLFALPKSGLGFKYRLQLDNTTGIIDSDYYYSDNEGHIFVKLTNDSKTPKDLIIKKSQSICQGILLAYGITYNDDVKEIRNGGLGSTTK